jgi:hypothetical protein
MPVLMPWAGQVGAVIYAWLPGQAIGEALAPGEFTVQVGRSSRTCR